LPTLTQIYKLSFPNRDDNFAGEKLNRKQIPHPFYGLNRDQVMAIMYGLPGALGQGRSPAWPGRWPPGGSAQLSGKS
jgi:hypothetical protein